MVGTNTGHWTLLHFDNFLKREWPNGHRKHGTRQTLGGRYAPCFRGNSIIENKKALDLYTHFVYTYFCWSKPLTDDETMKIGLYIMHNKEYKACYLNGTRIKT